MKLFTFRFDTDGTAVICYGDKTRMIAEQVTRMDLLEELETVVNEMLVEETRAKGEI
jgi:hypothetical protein